MFNTSFVGAHGVSTGAATVSGASDAVWGGATLTSLVPYSAAVPGTTNTSAGGVSFTPSASARLFTAFCSGASSVPADIGADAGSDAGAGDATSCVGNI